MAAAATTSPTLCPLAAARAFLAAFRSVAILANTSLCSGLGVLGLAWDLLGLFPVTLGWVDIHSITSWAFRSMSERSQMGVHLGL